MQDQHIQDQLRYEAEFNAYLDAIAVRRNRKFERNINLWLAFAVGFITANLAWIALG